MEALNLNETEWVKIKKPRGLTIPALDAGLIEMTIPEKPNSRFQKYRLTEKGERFCDRI